jgi:hypothetical protein
VKKKTVIFKGMQEEYRMTSEVSNILKTLILQGGSNYTIAGLWAGGVIAVLHPSDKPPSVFFQAKDLVGFNSSNVPLTRGLEISQHKISISGQNQSGLLLQASNFDELDPYFSLVDFLFEKLSFESHVEASWRVILDVIQEWMEFWSTKGKPPMREVILGLIGELATITSLLAEDLELSFEVWQGPQGGNHDFQFGQRAIEVKVCGSRSGGLVHKISSQRQLEVPESGELFVHSLRVQLGPNFTKSVTDLIEDAERSFMFNSPEGAKYFRDSMGLILKTSDIPRELSTFAVLESHLFKVDETFPRILSSDLRKGVIDVKYSVDLTSLGSESTRSDDRKFLLSHGMWLEDLNV